MGLDIHGVLGEVVAESGEKKQERVKWALWSWGWGFLITSRTIYIWDDFHTADDRKPYYLTCSYAEMPGHHLDCTDSKAFTESPTLCQTVLGTWDTVANTTNKNLGLMKLKFLLRGTNDRIKECQMVLSTVKSIWGWFKQRGWEWEGLRGVFRLNFLTLFHPTDPFDSLRIMFFKD